MYVSYSNGIQETFDYIPENYKNISGFNLLTNAERAAIGFYCTNVDKPSINPVTHTQATEPVVALNGDVVDITYATTAKSLATVQSELIASGRAQTGDEILASYPVYMQLNREVPGRLTQQEIDTMDAFIDSKRSAWNTKEAAINAAVNVDDALAAFNA